jgi:short-subunit dehydrogenase
MTSTDNAISTSARPEIVAIVGATSSLAHALCHALARQGYGLALAARDPQELEPLAGDLMVRYGTGCTLLCMDFLADDFAPADWLDRLGDFDHLVMAVGNMGNGDNADLANLSYCMHLNYTIPVHIATLAAQRLTGKPGGSIVIISSVAGDRGRRSNYAYGSAKAALSAFASGLRAYMYPYGVHVLTVKPGFIDTPMTWGMRSPLIASRDYAAKRIIAAMQKRKNCVYVPFYWRYIVLVIRSIPEWLFKRLAL